MSVRLEPTLEIEIDGAVAVADVKQRDKTPITRSVTINASGEGSRVVDGDDMSMGDLLTYSRGIEKDIQAYGRR